MPDTRRALGTFGETAATAHLSRQGYTVVERGWHCSRGELDIIARKGEQLVFVEVRTRRGTALTTPEESITSAKQTRLIALAHAYLEAHELPADSVWRIDVVAIVVNHAGRIIRLTHVQDAIEE